MSLKSKIAFQFTLDDMEWQLYFWTFTFVKPTGLPQCSRAWNRFWSKKRSSIYNCYPSVGGIRVFEEHPGKAKGWVPEDYSHGWHIHLVCNKFMDIDLVKQIASREGLGRTDVRKIKKEEAGYIGKYLPKKRRGAYKHIHLWAAVGLINAHRVSDIEVKSRFTDTYYYLVRTIHGFKTLPWYTRKLATWEFMHGGNILDALHIAHPEEYSEKDAQPGDWDEILEKVDKGEL